MPVYDAAMAYQAEGVPLVVFAGKEYGTGSSRDWAAKGTRLLGRARRRRRELRAHPPLEPGGNGRAAAGVHRGRDAEEPGAGRQRAGRPGRHRRRHHAPHDRDLPHSPRRRLGAGGPAPLPDRHRRRGRLLPPRRHPALRAARPRQSGIEDNPTLPDRGGPKDSHLPLSPSRLLLFPSTAGARSARLPTRLTARRAVARSGPSAREGGGGTRRRQPFLPLLPAGEERAGVRWGVSRATLQTSDNVG